MYEYRTQAGDDSGILDRVANFLGDVVGATASRGDDQILLVNHTAISGVNPRGGEVPTACRSIPNDGSRLQ